VDRFAVDSGNAGDMQVTAAGYERLQSELATLRTDGRREMGERLREARKDGDLANNPTVFDLLEEQAELERRIAVLEGHAASAQVVDPTANGMAGIGSVVGVRHLDTGEMAQYELVGSIDPDVGNGRVSVSAPVGGRSSVGTQARQSRPRRRAGRLRSKFSASGPALTQGLSSGGPHEPSSEFARGGSPERVRDGPGGLRRTAG
jgi:transcription elongation factor GreA